MSNVVMRPLAVACVLAAALASACGNLSQEDLLFLGAIPAKEAVEVRPAGVDSTAAAPGTARQAMEAECAPTDIRCSAANVSSGLNGITFLLLDLVDAIVQHPPTTRERGRRVWGPFFDFPKNNTGRFEIQRLDDGVTFAFCLHAVDGRIDDGSADDMSCDTDVDEDSGLTLLLSGRLQPGRIDGARARTGLGSMTLLTARIPDLAPIGREAKIEFDNRDDGTIIDIEITGQRAFGDVAERPPLEYSFVRDASGAGTFGFVAFANFDNLDEEPTRVRVERLDMVAKWNDAEAGTGIGRVSEGDLADDEVRVVQCWDEEQAQVYVRADISTQAEPLGEEGDIGQCAFDEEDVAALLPRL